jgi:DNA-binding SARP family transcriptional activator
MGEGTAHGHARSRSCRLTLTGEFGLLLDGRRVSLAHSTERVVAYLALARQPVHRSTLAGVLWPDVPQSQACRSLRTALWRLHRSAVPLLDVQGDRIGLTPRLRIDLADSLDLARQLLGCPSTEDLERLSDLVDRTELLTGWDDEWVAADRERFRLLRLAALESGARCLIDRGDIGRALDAALAASQSDPLRDSARRLIVRIHLSEGNLAAAIREYEDYRQTLADEVGVEPSPELRSLLGAQLAAAGGAGTQTDAPAVETLRSASVTTSHAGLTR